VTSPAEPILLGRSDFVAKAAGGGGVALRRGGHRFEGDPSKLSVLALSVVTHIVNGGANMLIDCETCPVQGEGCPDCVVAYLLDRPPVPVDLDVAERRALHRLAEAGLVPPLQPLPTMYRSAGGG
jgi:hypothetical protein